jgi:hypothetical protein
MSQNRQCLTKVFFFKFLDHDGLGTVLAYRLERHGAAGGLFM